MADECLTPVRRPKQRLCRQCCGPLPIGAVHGVRYCSEDCHNSAIIASRRRRYAEGKLYYPRCPIGFCRRCGAVFLRTSSRKSACDPCRPILKKAYNASLPKDPEKVREWDRSYRERIGNAKRRERRKTCKLSAMNGRMGCAVRRALRDRKDGKSWEALVGYTASELVVHIDRQFAKGMGWHNMDDWHVDHIIPLASFNYDDPSDPEFKAAWALTNLRPLWAKDNLRKHAKIQHLI